MTIQQTLSDNKGFITFLVISLLVAFVVVYYITFVYSNSEYERAKTDLNSVNTCSGLILFNSNKEYNINIWQADSIHKEIIKKLGDMKCP